MTFFTFPREMEAQQVLAGRGVQGVRAVPGGGHAGAGVADLRRGRHLRHGRPLYAAGHAVHAALRQEDCRLASGNYNRAHTTSTHAHVHAQL